MTVIDRLRATICNRVDYTFLIEPATGRAFSYGEFWNLAGCLASMLADKGVKKGDRVALLLKNSAELACFYFACLRGGYIAMPMDASLPQQQLEFLIQSYSPRIIVLSSKTHTKIDHSHMTSLNLLSWCINVAREEPENSYSQPSLLNDALKVAPLECDVLHEATLEDLFVITFTSGTTGTPKGVANRVFGFLENVEAFNDMVGIMPESRMLHVFPMVYMAGFLNTLLSPFVAGGSVIIADAFDAKIVLGFWKTVLAEEINTLWLNPTMVQAITRVKKQPEVIDYCKSRIRSISVGTAPLSAQIKEAFEIEFGIELLESYGLSELLYVTSNTLQHPRIPKSVGRLLRGIDIRISGQRPSSCQPSSEGVIEIRTPYLMAGYLSQETGGVIKEDLDGWFATGDIGYIDEYENLYITGRKKDLIIKGGVNVSPRAVEEVLMSTGVFEQVAVIGLPHQFYGEEVVAAVKMDPGIDLESATEMLRETCKRKLSVPSIPTRFVEISAFPVGISGKIQKHKLREMIILEIGEYK